MKNIESPLVQRFFLMLGEDELNSKMEEFFRDNCQTFAGGGEGEQDHASYKLFLQYQSMIETALANFIEKEGLEQAELMKEIKAACGQDAMCDMILHIFLCSVEYELFCVNMSDMKAMMAKG